MRFLRGLLYEIYFETCSVLYKKTIFLFLKILIQFITIKK
ncbi:hypothetical protein LEP1GSC198_3312 [Leptospira kirschneri str. JB]|nr:hypothetical protein LEP1GSC198_3312 [Leptospira kirschneri str. JB]